MRFILLLSFLLPLSMVAQRTNDINQSLQLRNSFDEDGNLTVTWLPKEDAEQYIISTRTDLNSPFQFVENNIQDTFYSFSEPITEPLEISITKIGGTTATGYILAAKDYWQPSEEKHTLILVESNLLPQVSSVLINYQQVLQNELNRSKVIAVDQSMLVSEVKNLILEEHSLNEIDYILLVGHVPVPYSGNMAIDGHTPDHMGAWVCDGYYGDVDGVWTDQTINTTQANREANRNVPGDGKFDQTFFPSQVDIPVGRVDFSRLPALNQSEAMLTNRYFERNILYRTGEIKATNRGMIDNNFNLPEGFGQGAIKSFSGFFPLDSIHYGTYRDMNNRDYLWSYGAGAGNYQGASGIINTSQAATDSIQTIFTTVFGSYFGDWDIENNLLRATLARGTTLINAWSGRPIWYFHQMAIGKTFGEVLLNTQNNNGNYTSQFGKRMIHTSLLGDPTLKMYYHKPVENIQLELSNEVSVSWTPLEEGVEGYAVYYRTADQGWNLASEEIVRDTFVSFVDENVTDFVEVVVRPVFLIESPSGSYFNEGAGTKMDIIISSSEDVLISNTKIFPNPTSHSFSITGLNASKSVHIYNQQGQLVYKTFYNGSIDISILNPGNYYVRTEYGTMPIVKL